MWGKYTSYADIASGCLLLLLPSADCINVIITSVEVTGRVSESLLSELLVMFSSFLCMSVGSTGRARSVYHWTKRTSCKCLSPSPYAP